MPIHNRDIARTFNKVADLLEIDGANPFRVRSYRNAARTMGNLSRSVSDMVTQGDDLSGLSSIGKDLAGKIEKFVKTGKFPLLKKLEQKHPPHLIELLDIPGLGAKKVHSIYEKLGISTLNDLKKAAQEKKLRQIEGLGPKTEKQIIEEISRLKEEHKERIMLMEAREIVQPFKEYLKKGKGVKDLVVAGSYRRNKETVGDLDILVTCKKDSPVMERFVKFEDVNKVISRGETRSTIILRSGIQVDLRVVPQVSYGAALHYFTGSKDHNIVIRKIGQKKGCKINEYGVFKGKKRIAGKTEEEVYRQVDLPFIEPELRENRGEIEAARKGRLPSLVTLKNIRGDLHTHTKETDGHSSLREMVKAARDLGYTYIAVTEHSKKVTVAHGLDSKRLSRQIKEIDKLNGKLKGFTIFKGIEVDILEDGSLDLPDDILKELDLTVCSVHYKLNLSRKKQTERIIRAMDNRFFTILGHPTGRMIQKRRAYEVDMEKVMEAAKERGCFLELNAHPERLDLTDTHCKMAKEKGLLVAISTDAHSTDNLNFMEFGVGQGRRGWLSPDDVINTRDLNDLNKLLKRN